MPDKPVAETRPLTPGNQPHKVRFNFIGIPLFRKVKTVSEPSDVSINHNAFVQAKGVSKYNISRLAADPRELDQLGH